MERGDRMAAPPSAPEREWLEAVFDLMPAPLVLMDPETGAATYANRAAHRLAGGRFPLGAVSERDNAEYWVSDPDGARLGARDFPSTRAARGERVEGFQMAFHTPAGVRQLIVSADTIPPLLGQPAMVMVSFEDVGAMYDAEERLRGQAGEITRLYREAREAERRKDESLALLDTLLATAPVGLAFLDRDLRYVRVNEALAEINGMSPEEHVGRSQADVVPGVGHTVRDACREVLATGRPLLDHELSGETPAAPGELRHWLVSYYPVHAGDGEVLGIGAVVHDTTERKRAEEERARLLAAERAERERAERAERRWSFLAEAGELLNASLDYEETLRRLAEVCVPELADWCLVDMLAPDGRIDRLAVAHADPRKERLGWDLAARWPPHLDDEAGIGAALRAGHLVHNPEITPELLRRVARDDEHLAVLVELGFGSSAIVPLDVRGRVLGGLTLAVEPGRRFRSEDLELADELARRAATAVLNARLYRERSTIARTLQDSLLPPLLPEIPGFQVAARYRAGGEGFEVGGDFYDLFETSPGRWAAVIGDVCGKGADAAALTALARHTVRAAAIQEPSPGRVLRTLNDAMLRGDTQERFCTAVYATLHQGKRAALATLACGGHPLPLVLRADGRVEVAGAPGTLLGIEQHPTLADRALELGPGDALVLYTDGVSDVPSPAGVLAPGELRRILADAAGLDAEGIAERIEAPLAAREGPGSRDDAAILVLRRRP